jgi:hypothetical protein
MPIIERRCEPSLADCEPAKAAAPVVNDSAAASISVFFIKLPFTTDNTTRVYQCFCLADVTAIALSPLIVLDKEKMPLTIKQRTLKLFLSLLARSNQMGAAALSAADLSVRFIVAWVKPHRGRHRNSQSPVSQPAS